MCMYALAYQHMRKESLLSYTLMCLGMYIHVCMHVRTYVRTYVCVCALAYQHIAISEEGISQLIHTDVLGYACVYACMCMCALAYQHIAISEEGIPQFIHTDVFGYVCVCVCMYVYVCTGLPAHCHI